MSSYTITPEEISANSVSSAPDILEGSVQDNKEIFDRLGGLIAQRHNTLGSEFSAHKADNNNPHALTAQKIGALDQDSVLPGENVVITKNPDGSITIISTGGGGGGGGDMYRSIYDTDSDGVVDLADRAGTAEHASLADSALVADTATVAQRAVVADNGIGGYTHTVVNGKHTLTGIGVTANFKASTSATVGSFMVNDTECSVVLGDETEIELVTGRWYSFILDVGNNTVNFNTGGAALNYKVIGDTTEPINPTENTIWINTDTAIADYSIEKHNGFLTPFEGAVWIAINPVGNISFSIAKKHRVEISPSTASQYIGGTWISKEAKIFTGGAWKQFSFVDYSLFDNGALPMSWVQASYTTNGQGTSGFNVTQTINISANYAGGASARVTAAVTDEAIDVSGYNSVWFEIAQSSTALSYYLGVNETKQTDSTGLMTKRIVVSEKGVSVLDIKDIEGDMYVMAMCAGATSKPNVTAAIQRVWLSGEIVD